MAPTTNPMGHYPPITPHLAVSDGAAAIAFYERAFGAEEVRRFAAPDGTVAHAEVRIGGQLVTLGQAIPAYGLVSPDPDGPVHVAITFFCDDVDKVFAQAVEAGATSVSEPAEQFHGDRTGTLRCPFGHRWHVATHTRDIPQDEQQQAFLDLMSGS
jgi:PhnB protein